jgi:DNA-binding NarL/FixJ family response regulator
MRCGSVLLADSHSPLLDGIRSLLDERFEVVVMVADVRSLLETMEKLQPDLVIVDVSLPHTVGQNVIAMLHDRFRGINVIALSGFDDRVVTDRSLASGAVAVVLKSSAVTDLGPALDAIGCGRQYLSPSVRVSSDALLKVTLDSAESSNSQRRV